MYHLSASVLQQEFVLGECLEDIVQLKYHVNFDHDEFKDAVVTSPSYVFNVSRSVQPMDLEVGVTPTLSHLGLTGFPLSNTLNLRTCKCYGVTSFPTNLG